MLKVLKRGVNLTLDTWQECLLKGKKRGEEERIEEGKAREGKEKKGSPNR